MKAVLFDLDDTLFDHKNSRLKGLEALQQKFQKLRTIPLQELEEEHERLLGDADYCTVSSGNLVMADVTTQGISKLCSMYGIKLSIDEEKNAVDLYTKEYLKNRQSVPGSSELLTTLMNYAKLGVIANGRVDQEMEKLKACKIDQLIDYFIISESDSCRKPSKQLFEVALEKVGVTPSNAVYVGNSWNCDILPAVDMGIKAVWLNRYGLENPNPTLANEINTFIDVDKNLFL